MKKVQKPWQVVRCRLDELPGHLKLLEDAGYNLWSVILEHSEYTILAYLSIGERERQGIPPHRLDRNPYGAASVEPHTCPCGDEHYKTRP